MLYDKDTAMVWSRQGLLALGVHAAYSDQHGIEMVHAAWWERELEELDRQERREGRLSTWYGWYD